LPTLQPVTALRDIGAHIRAARRRQGLRIDDAASLCGVSVDLLSRLENGKGGVGTDKVLLVLDALGMELFVAPKGHPGLRALVRQEVTDG
jgi:transcriptional regulator with XRE-family HTH domain